MNKKLTISQIKRLPVPKAGFTETSAGSVPGLRVRVLSSGIRSFVFRYKLAGRNGVITLGRVDDVQSLQEAETRAKELRWQVDGGNDPAQERREQRQAAHQVEHDAESNPLFKGFARDFMERYSKRRKKSWRGDEHMLNRHILPALGALHLHDIKRRDIVKLLNAVVDRGAPMQANHVRALLSCMFNWAIKQALLEHNPVTQTERQPTKSRDRVLSKDEIRQLWSFTDDTHIAGYALRMVLLSGQRPGEVASMKWADIREGVWYMADTKNGKPHSVPISREMQQVLDTVRVVVQDRTRDKSGADTWVFVGSGGNHLRECSLAQRMRAYGWECAEGDRPRPHDLRRTAITTVSMLGYGREVQDKVANHADHSVGGVYDRYSYQAEKLKALEALGVEVRRIVHGADVLTFPKVGIK